MKRLSLPFKSTYPHSQGFGENPSMYARFSLLGHNGDDYALPNGVALYAPISGKVTKVGNIANGYGIYLNIWDESQLLVVILAHMQSVLVKEGDNVQAGQKIGFSDNTGYSTGPHLHIAVGDQDITGVRANYNNGYAGWYSVLDSTKIEVIALPAEPASVSGSVSPPDPAAGGAPNNTSILAPRNSEEFYGVVPQIELAITSAVGGQTVEYNIFISSAVGNWQRGWSTDRFWIPPLTDFNNINYGISGSSRVLIDGIPKESPGTNGITIVIHSDRPPPSKWEPDGEWVRSSQADYDVGVPGVYGKYGDIFWRTVNTDRERHSDINELSNAGISYFSARGNYSAISFEGTNFSGAQHPTIISDQPWKNGYFGASSWIVWKQQPALPQLPEPDPIVAVPYVEPTPTIPVGELVGTVSPELVQSISRKVDDLLIRVDRLEKNIGGIVTATPPVDQATGFFTVDSVPNRASIYVDNQFQFDYTPSNLTYRLVPGIHRLALRKRGYKAYEENFTVAADQEYKKIITLEQL